MNPEEELRELQQAVIDGELTPEHIAIAQRLQAELGLKNNWLACLAGGNPAMMPELTEEVQDLLDQES